MARFLSILILLPSLLFCQAPSLEFKAKFQQAKIYLKNKEYSSAKSAFESLKSSIPSTYSPYILYYLGMSQYKLNENNEAESSLAQLQSKFKEWTDNEDLNYLLGLIYFKKDEIEKGLTSFNKIKNTAFDKKIESCLIANLKSKTTEKNLKELVLRYSNIVGLKNILNTSEAKNIYGLDPKNLPVLPNKINSANINNTLNIGILFPFNSDTLNSINNYNQYAYDLYEGMLMAIEKLLNEGITVKLHAYDVGNDKAKMLALLHNRDFINENLIFGPLHSESNSIAQYYANELKIPLVNPLSKNTNLVKNKAYCFLANGSTDAYNKQAIKFIQNNFFGEIAIIYGNTPEDNATAMAISAELNKNKTNQISVKFNNIESLNKLSTKKIACILLCSQPTNSLNIINAIDKKIGIVPIISSSASFPENAQVNESISNELYIFSQDFIDENSENVKAFKLDFWNKKNSIPSEYTMKGFDMMLFWARQLVKYKERAVDMLKFKSSNDDYLLSGFDYSVQANENASYSIVTLQKGQKAFYKKQ